MAKDKKEKTAFLSTPEALALVREHGINVSRMTMTNWCKRYKVGKQINNFGRWYINKDKLVDLIKSIK